MDDRRPASSLAGTSMMTLGSLMVVGSRLPSLVLYQFDGSVWAALITSIPLLLLYWAFVALPSWHLANQSGRATARMAAGMCAPVAFLATDCLLFAGRAFDPAPYILGAFLVLIPFGIACGLVHAKFGKRRVEARA